MKRRMRSSSVTTVLIGLMSLACDSGEDTVIVQTDHGQICVHKETLERVPDDWCEDGNHTATHAYVWTNAGHPGPPVSQKMPTGSYTTTRPTSGTIGTVPPSGGFGTTVVSGGS